jgi:hypothetical protein
MTDSGGSAVGQVTEELEQSAPSGGPTGTPDPWPLVLWGAAVVGLALAISAPPFLAAVVGIAVAGAALVVALTRRQTELGLLVAAAVGAILVLPVAAISQWQSETSSGGTALDLFSADPSSADPSPPDPSTPGSSTPDGATELPPDGVDASTYAEDSLDASGETVTFVPANAVDGDPGTTWRVPGDGVGDYITLSWDEPVVVDTITVIPGYAKIDEVDGTDRFYQNRRVVEAEISLDEDYTRTVTFADEPNPQAVDVPGVTASSVTVVILSTTDPGERDFAAVSEILVEGSP